MSGNCHWFTGVVEDIHDPEKMNRVKVRLHGLHSDKLELDPAEGKGMSTDELPWAYVSMPTTGAGIHGFGQSPHGLLEGSWVWGLSRDGAAFNELVVCGVLLGRPTEENPNDSGQKKAFFGMDGLWPDKEFLDKPDVHRLARADLEFDEDRWKPIPIIKDEERITDIPKISGTWDEKESAYDAEYPYNKILFDSPNRTLVEIDETPGAERFAEWHGPSHTYREVQPDGSIQHRITGDNFTIVQKDNNLFVEGDVNITVVGNANILSTEGDVNIDSKKGSVSVKSLRGMTLRADVGSLNIESIARSINLSAPLGNINLSTVAQNINLNSGAGAIVLSGKSLVINSASVSGLGI